MIIEQISDIHFGALPDDEDLYNQLQIFVDHCKKVVPDLIVIAGDCYDKRVNIESASNIYFNKFIDDIRQIGSTIIIIEGTFSHDKKQISALAHYCSNKFFIVEYASELNICGLKLLILPEEYVRDGESYYKTYLNKQYDFVFGHGMFSHVGFGKDSKIGDIIRKSFTFSAKDFENVKYYVGFGHIHTHSCHKNIIYSGSYSRLNFGEEEPKGWVEYEIKNNKCKWKFLENTKAPTFTSIKASDLSEDVEEMMNYLRNQSQYNDYLRIIIEDGISDNKLNNILGFVKNFKNTCILRKSKSKEEKRTNEIEEMMKIKQKELNEKMKDLDGMNFIEITQTIAKRDYNEDFDTDYILKILNTKL